VRGVYSEGLFFRGRTVIVPPCYVPHLARPRPGISIARAAYIIQGAVLSESSSSSKAKAPAAAAAASAAAVAGPGVLASGRSLCVLPPRTPGVDNACAVRVLQLDESSMQVPRPAKGEATQYFLVHLSMLAAGGTTQAVADGVLASALDVLLRKRNAVR
jgi:hypothetical protein